MIITLTIPGNPVGWQRAGHNRSTGATYTQQKTRIAESAIAWEYVRKYGSKMFPKKTALRMDVIAYMPIPKNTPWVTQAKMITGEIRPTIKADWDNYGKLVSDSLNGVAYDDDKCIVDGIVRKFYSENPRTEITITDKLNNAPLA